MSVADNNSGRRILENIVSLISGRLFISLSRLIISLIIVRMLNTEIFGTYVVVMSIIYIGEWLMDFGFTDIAVRNISQDASSRVSVLRAFTAIKVLQTFLAYGSVVLAIYFLGYTELLPAIGIGGIALLFYGGAQVYRVDFRVNMAMHRDMLSESSGVLIMIILVLFFSMKGAGVMELVACHTVSRFVYLIGNMYRGSGQNRPKLSFSDSKAISTLIRQSAPLGLAGIMVACYDSVIPLVLSKLLSMESVALYTVAIRLVFPIVLITQAISNVFYTPLSNYWGSNKQLFVATQQNLVEIICIVACGFFCLLHSGSEFIVSFFGESMSESATILRALSWAILARALTIAMAAPIIICGGQRKTMWLTLFVVILSVILVVYLVPRYGIFGAVGTYLFTEIVATALPVIFVSLYMADYRLNWPPVIKLFVAAVLATAITASLPIDGSAIGGIFSLALYASIAYVIGGISNKRVETLLAIIRNRSTTQEPQTEPAAGEPDRPIKIALACPGVGLVQRGFERMFHDIFHLLKDDLDITLYKGGGANTENEKRLRFINRNSRLLRIFPIHRLAGRRTIHVENLTFALSLLFAIRGQSYDLIHCTDPPLARVLYKLRRLFRLKFRLLYSEACAMPPSDYPAADHMQQISQATYNEAVECGIPEDYMTMLPLGIYPESFTVTASKSELRKKYGIADDTFVVLSVAAINRYHKSIDYLIDEFSSVKGNALLWIDGSLDLGDPDLIQYAKEKLGDRCKVTHLPTKDVGELFAVADIMAHTALFEAFGLAPIEGAAAGITVLTHNAAHFKWLMNNEDCAIDMSVVGMLSKRIEDLMANPDQISSLSNRDQILARYSWQELKSAYTDMYVKTANLPAGEIGIAHHFGLS